MRQYSDTDSVRKRSFTLYFGAVFSLLIGGLALVTAILGFLGKGGAADIHTAFPNLITFIASIAGAVGYLALKKWAVPVYAVAVIGHIISHTMLYMIHAASGRVSSNGIIILLLIPGLSILILAQMEHRRRIGLLT